MTPGNPKENDNTGIEPTDGVQTHLESIATDTGPVTKQIETIKGAAFESPILKGVLTECETPQQIDRIKTAPVTPETIRLAQQHLVDRFVALLDRENHSSIEFVKTTGIAFLISRFGLEIETKWKKFLRVLSRVEKDPNLSLSRELKKEFCPETEKRISDIRGGRRRRTALKHHYDEHPKKKNSAIPADMSFAE